MKLLKICVLLFIFENFIMKIVKESTSVGVGSNISNALLQLFLIHLYFDTHPAVEFHERNFIISNTL